MLSCLQGSPSLREKKLPIHLQVSSASAEARAAIEAAGELRDLSDPVCSCPRESSAAGASGSKLCLILRPRDTMWGAYLRLGHGDALTKPDSRSG